MSLFLQCNWHVSGDTSGEAAQLEHLEQQLVDERCSFTPAVSNCKLLCQTYLVLRAW